MIVLKTFKSKSAMILSVLAIVALGIQSCGDDPDDPSKNLPSENDSEFVGGWQGSMGEFLFFNDGNAKLNSYEFGKWTFDNNTNILATTLDKWQFIVTLTSTDQWAAIAASGTGTYTFDRLGSIEYAYALMAGSSYVSEDGESGVCGNLQRKQVGTNSIGGNKKYTDALEFNGLFGYITFEDDGDDKDNTFKYTLYSLERHVPYRGESYYYLQVQHSGSAVFSDMHSSDKCKLAIKSNSSKSEDIVQHTFTLKNIAQEK